jgi:hypothetical protein
MSSVKLKIGKSLDILDILDGPCQFASTMSTMSTFFLIFNLPDKSRGDYP